MKKVETLQREALRDYQERMAQLLVLSDSLGNKNLSRNIEKLMSAASLDQMIIESEGTIL